MEVIYLQVFVSLGLVVGSLLLFAYSTRQRDLDHVERMALFPIDEERTGAPEAPLKGASPRPGES